MQDDVPEPYKFYPPGLPFGFIDRPGLLTALAEGLSSRLVVVKAPAGYGKTSLLASLAAKWDRLASARHRLAWYSLDATDDDPSVFVEGLVAAVHRAAPPAGRDTLSVLRGVRDARLEVERLIRVISRELGEAGVDCVTVVLDDFHLLTDKAILDCLEQLIKGGDLPLRLVIGTEREPSWYLAQLRAQRAVVDLKDEHFVFSQADLAALLRARSDEPPSPKVVENLARETRGWPSAAAVAAAIVVRSGGPLPMSRLAPTEHGYSQLVREFLNGLAPRVRDGLLRSSLLEVVDRQGLTPLVGTIAPEALIAAIHGLSVPGAWVGTRRDGIRFDPVFRVALERELASSISPRELLALQKMVASFHAGAGRPAEAVRAHLRAGAHDAAARLIDDAAAIELASGHLDNLLGWLRAVPNSIRKERPRLMVHEARALLRRGNLGEARALLVAVEPQLRAREDQSGLAQRNGAWCALHLAEGRHEEAATAARDGLAQLPADQYGERAELFWMLAQAQEMLGLLRPSFEAAAEGLVAAERSGRQGLAVRALAQLAHLAEQRGSYSEAIALSGRSVQKSVVLGTELLSVARDGGLAASVYLERGQSKEAAAAADLVLEADSRFAVGEPSLRAALIRARVDEDFGGEPLDARLGGLLRASDRAVPPSIDRALVDGAVAASMLRRGRRDEAVRWARQSVDEAVAARHKPSVERSRLVELLVKGKGVGLLARLSAARRLRETFSSMGDRRWLSAGHIVTAEAYTRLGLGWRARSNLESALRLAADEGYTGLPLGIPFRAEGLLSLAVRHRVQPEVAGSLLGITRDGASKVLEPLLFDKSASIREGAERAAKGLELEIGRAPAPMLPWPGVAEDPQAPVVALQVLGDMSSFVDSRPVDWPSNDARVLAAYLVLRRAIPIPREELLADVWPDLSVAEATVRFNVALYRLRESLGAGYPAVHPTAESDGYCFWDGIGCFIDVDQFRSLVAEIDGELGESSLPVLPDVIVRLSEQATTLYQGELLAAFPFPWCIEPREQLRSQFLRISRLLIDHYMAAREWKEVIRHGLKSLQSDPLQEEVVRDLMLCYFRIGDRPSVMKQYREVKRHLAKERGVWPSDETRQLRLRLLGK